MKLSAYSDGGSRGNPGPSGYGLVIYNESKNIVYQHSSYLGIKTNNEAEYAGLLAVLTWVQDHSPQVDLLRYYSDSELLIRQLNGQYRVKSPHLKPLFAQVLAILATFPFPFSCHHIPRELNSLSDSLANQAMDTRHAS